MDVGRDLGQSDVGDAPVGRVRGGGDLGDRGVRVEPDARADRTHAHAVADDLEARVDGAALVRADRRVEHAREAVLVEAGRGSRRPRARTRRGARALPARACAAAAVEEDVDRRGDDHRARAPRRARRRRSSSAAPTATKLRGQRARRRTRRGECRRAASSVRAQSLAARRDDRLDAVHRDLCRGRRGAAHAADARVKRGRRLRALDAAPARRRPARADERREALRLGPLRAASAASAVATASARRARTGERDDRRRRPSRRPATAAAADGRPRRGGPCRGRGRDVDPRDARPGERLAAVLRSGVGQGRRGEQDGADDERRDARQRPRNQPRGELGHGAKVAGAPTLLAVRLRDLPSVDELARGIDDPLAVDAARAVLARAREEIRAGADPGDLRGLSRRARRARGRRRCGVSSTRRA